MSGRQLQRRSVVLEPTGRRLDVLTLWALGKGDTATLLQAFSEVRKLNLVRCRFVDAPFPVAVQELELSLALQERQDDFLPHLHNTKNLSSLAIDCSSRVPELLDASSLELALHSFGHNLVRLTYRHPDQGWTIRPPHGAFPSTPTMVHI